MRDCKITKKALSVLLALSMVLSWTPIPTHAADVDTCTHHAEHTADCGYVAAVAGSPCIHVCAEACVDGCVHSVHDDNCGYIAGSEGTPCAYDCQENHGTTTSEPEATTEPTETSAPTEPSVPETTEGETVPETTETEPVCTCGTDDSAIHATNCPLYEAPENPACFCAEKCTEETANIWCDVCGYDYTACEGEETATLYDDGCVHEAGDTTTVVNGICSICKVYGWCGASGSESSVIWKLENGTLTISGSGAMADYEEVEVETDVYRTSAPWGSYADSIEQVVVEGITYVGNYAFLRLYKLKSVTLDNDSVETIGELAFCWCKELSSLVLPDSLKEIAFGAFAFSGLQSVEIPNCVITIGDQVFYFCKTLETLVIPASAQNIGSDNFVGCETLKTVRFWGETEPIGIAQDAFSSYYAPTIYVPCTYTGTTFGGKAVTNGHFEAVTGKSNLTYSVSGNSIVQYCNHCQTTATATLVIKENKAYDGENKVSVAYTDGWLGGNLDVIEAIQPGTYTASISFDNQTVSETFEITKNQLTITAKDQTITYGESIAFGADQVDAVLGTGDTLTITLTPSTDKATDNGTITPSDAKITNASGADVTDNYVITYETGKLIINKSEPVITFNAEYTPSKTYDNEAVNEPTVENITVSAKYDGNVVFTWYKDSVSEDNRLDAAPKDAGTYILLASIAETENNNAATKELTVTISKAPAFVTEAPTAVSGLIYTGVPQKLVSGGKVEGGTLVYSTTQDGIYTEIITYAAAGIYEVWYKVLGDANHSDSTPVMLTAEIAPATVTNAVVTVTGTYSYTSKEIIPSVSEIIVTLDGKTLTYDTDYTFVASNNIDVGTNTAIVTVTFKGNYTGTATGTFTINPCPHNEFKDKKCTQCGGICGVVKDHAYTNGICVNGCYQPATDENQDGTYEISNAGQLYWFAALINGTLPDVSQNTAAKAVLTADITMPEKKQWTPIGNNASQFEGIFDGQSHTISGLYFNDTEAMYVGLIGAMQNNSAAIRNVCVLNVSFYANRTMGGICGFASAGCTIENCYVTGSISGTSSLGGIVGGAGTFVKVSNCCFVGNANGDSSLGEIVGSVNSATIKNCYYLSDSETDSLDGTTAKTSAQFASGEVAYLLQGSQTTEIWGQTIGTDSYPVLGGAKAYQVTGCQEGTTAYSNDSTATGVHNYVNGTCTICGDTIELISVDITWGAMEFTYTDGAWNAETHSYGEGSWSDNGTGWVNVKNSGNVAVTVTYDYGTERTDIFGSFTDGTNAITTSVTLPAGEEKKAWLILNGKPSTALNGETIGTVTVTIGR